MLNILDVVPEREEGGRGEEQGGGKDRCSFLFCTQSTRYMEKDTLIQMNRFTLWDQQSRI